MAVSQITKGAPKGASKVFIAVPTYSGKLDTRLAHSIMQALPKLEAEGLGYEFFTLSYHCHVDDARNEIVRNFLDSDCDALIFVDADVSFDPKELVKLAKHDKGDFGLIAGVYPKRSSRDLEFPVRVGSGVELRSDEQGLVEVEGAPTGFMKIPRKALQTIYDEKGARYYRSKTMKTDDKSFCIIFERTFTNGQRFSGDYSFCNKIKALGGGIYVDPLMFLSHMGEEVFQGTLGDYWKKKYGVYHKELHQKALVAINALRSGDTDAKHFQVLMEFWNNTFTASSELLMACYELAKETNEPILETGSGLSSIIMAIANPKIKVHCLEHDHIWASRLGYFCKIFGIDNVHVHFGELKTYPDGDWYNEDIVPKEKYGIVLCDGPPRLISNRSILYKKLDSCLKNAIVIMDDADDDQAVEPIKTWAENLGRRVEILGESRRFAISPRLDQIQ